MGQNVTKKAENAIRNGNGIILDIRTPAEFQQGHLCGAHLVNTPVPPLAYDRRQELYNNLKKLVRKYPNKTFIVYCKKGIRARLAVDMLETLGVSAVSLGGIHTAPLKQIMSGQVRNDYLKPCYILP